MTDCSENGHEIALGKYDKHEHTLVLLNISMSAFTSPFGSLRCPSCLYLCLQSHFVVLLVAGFVDGADAGADIP